MTDAAGAKISGPPPSSTDAVKGISEVKMKLEAGSENRSPKIEAAEKEDEINDDDREDDDEETSTARTSLSDDEALPVIPLVDESDLFGKAPEGFTRLEWLTFVHSLEKLIGTWIRDSYDRSMVIFEEDARTWTGDEEFKNEYARTFLRSFLLDKETRYDKLIKFGLDYSDSHSPWTISVKDWNKYKNVDNAITAGTTNEDSVFLKSHWKKRQKSHICLGKPY